MNHNFLCFNRRVTFIPESFGKINPGDKDGDDQAEIYKSDDCVNKLALVFQGLDFPCIIWFSPSASRVIWFLSLWLFQWLSGSAFLRLDFSFFLFSSAFSFFLWSAFPLKQKSLSLFLFSFRLRIRLISPSFLLFTVIVVIIPIDAFL